MCIYYIMCVFVCVCMYMYTHTYTHINADILICIQVTHFCLFGSPRVMSAFRLLLTPVFEGIAWY